ncbi:MAG: AI-2E family transporter YdiK [Planctomycetota bacterium]
MAQDSQRDLFRPILVVTILGLLLALSIWILKPFLPALIWATMVAVATWPMMLAVQARLWRRRWLAVLVMTIAMLLVFVVPFALAIGTLVTHMDDITGWVKSFDVHALETPPAWVGGIPLLGPHADSAWRELATTAELGDKVTPYAGKLATWFLGQLGSFGALVVQFLLTIVITAILYAKGEAFAEAILRCAHRIGGERGEASVLLASRAIRGVALGVVVTALVQSVLGGLGLAVVGVPYVPILTAAMFLFGVAQIGSGPILFCAVIWIFWKGDTGWGVALLVWTILVSTMDNFLRPMLIRKGADLPLLLIFVGVIGGLIAFGVVGIFVGPIVLAVTYTLISAWIAETPTPARTHRSGS